MKAPAAATPLLVRHARLDDGRALHAACFAGEPLVQTLDYLAWCLAGPARPLRLVALLEEEIVAHVEVMPRQEGRWLELSTLVVTPTRRGEGIGARTVRAVARLARRRGSEELRLQVETGRTDLLHLYRRWGFVPRGRPLAGRRWLLLPLLPILLSGPYSSSVSNDLGDEASFLLR